MMNVYSKQTYANWKTGIGPGVRLRAAELGKISQGGKTVEELTGE
jgi:hypothetical protein